MWCAWWATLACVLRVRGAIQISGDVVFDLRVPSEPPVAREAVTPPPPTPPPSPSPPKVKLVKPPTSAAPAPAASAGTAAPAPECVYQYPEPRQVNAMLSNMMNQLTKVFVRMHKYMSVSGRRGGAKRFRLVASKQSDFFDNIYANMTEEYRRFANETSARVRSAGRDPCTHQEEIRAVWRGLIDTSQESLGRAAMRCVEEYLRVQQRASSPRVRARATALLKRELKRVRTDQLALLCDNFQLCYSDLL